MKKTMGGVGEWGWLDRLLPGLCKGLPSRVVVGPGDDAALIRAGAETWAVSTDMLVEGVHFRKEWTSAEDLGHKTLAVNLSDLAAMGDVEPMVGVLSAGIPSKTPLAFVEGFHRGFQRLARRQGFFLVGGDTVRADQLVFSLTVVGRVRGNVFLRSKARVGDVVMVTGTLGGAAAGLELLESGAKKPLALTRRLLRPEPRLAWAQALARSKAVACGLDCSDGFWRSVRLIAGASQVGVRVDADRLPMATVLKKWAGGRAVDFALTGGEDYELIVTVNPAKAKRLASLGFLTAVGTIVSASEGVTIFYKGVQREVPPDFEHFNH